MDDVRELKRGAIFIDVEYFRIACSGAGFNSHLLKNSQSMIERIKWLCKDIPGVQQLARWRCYAYDAVYTGRAKELVGEQGVAEREQLHSWMKGGGYTSRFGYFSYREKDLDNGKGVIIQKEVDTWLVVDAMREAWQVDTDIFFLVAADADFIPLIKELRAYGRKTVVIYGSTRSINEEMRTAADLAVQI